MISQTLQNTSASDVVTTSNEVGAQLSVVDLAQSLSGLPKGSITSDDCQFPRVNIIQATAIDAAPEMIGKIFISGVNECRDRIVIFVNRCDPFYQVWSKNQNLKDNKIILKIPKKFHSRLHEYGIVKERDGVTGKNKLVYIKNRNSNVEFTYEFEVYLMSPINKNEYPKKLIITMKGVSLATAKNINTQLYDKNIRMFTLTVGRTEQWYHYLATPMLTVDHKNKDIIDYVVQDIKANSINYKTYDEVYDYSDDDTLSSGNTPQNESMTTGTSKDIDPKIQDVSHGAFWG